MLDDMEVSASDLAIDEIRELLVDAGADISLDQADELAAFIASAGGLEEALEVLSQLNEQRDAA
jgi:hypothetical protein